MRRYLVAAVVTLSCVAGVAACSGDDDAATTTTTATHRDESASSSTGSTDGGTTELRHVLDRQNNAVIRVAYQRGTDQFTIAQDRDVSSIRSGNSLSINEPTRSVDCIDLDTTPSCAELEPGVTSVGGLGLTFYGLLNQSLSALADTTPPVATTSDVVLGRPAVCAQGDASTFLSELSGSIGPVAPATVRVCVDEATGYVLSYRNESDPSRDLVATQVGKPSSADLEPPAAVEGDGEPN
jgi:hypothetical protein